jgi:Cytochrome c554 and c-prime
MYFPAAAPVNHVASGYPDHFAHTIFALRAEDATRHPDNKLHKNIQGTCSACHSLAAWKPATFEHDKFFELDRDHNVECVTCHVKNDYTRYSCYGCHEQTVQNVLREHREESIRDLDNCVSCHRRADGEGGEGDD